jgi:hypothetical protein
MVSIPIGNTAATPVFVRGLVSMFQFGGNDAICFKLENDDNTYTMAAKIDEQWSTGFAVIFTRAMANGCEVQVYSIDGGTTYAGVQLYDPGAEIAPDPTSELQATAGEN